MPTRILTFKCCLLAVLGLVLLALVLGLASEDAQGKTITVDDDGEGDYEKIQDAIDAADEGDEIRVWEGRYNEAITINKALSLQGNGSAKTVLDGDNAVSSVEITVDGVSLDNFKIIDGALNVIRVNGASVEITNNRIQGSDYGIYIKSGTGAILKNNSCLQNQEVGILVEAERAILENNSCWDNDIGIQLDEASYSRVANNTCYGNKGDGIDVRDFDEVYILNNSCHNNSRNGLGIFKFDDVWIENNSCHDNDLYGIDIGYNARAAFLRNNTLGSDNPLRLDTSYCKTHDIDTSNTLGGKPIYFYSEARDVKVPTDAGEVILAYCVNVSVEDMSFKDTKLGVLMLYSEECRVFNVSFTDMDYGLRLIYTKDSLISSCLFRNCSKGVSTEQSDKNVFEYNTGISNENSFFFASWSNDNILRYNNCSGDEDDAIHIMSNCGGGSVIFNNCSGNEGSGIEIRESGVLVANNICLNNGESGIDIGNSEDTLIRNNTACSNTVAGIFVGGTSDEVIMKNNTLLNNRYGIWVPTSGGDFYIYKNIISGNRDYGLYTSENSDFDAIKNWWGHPSGPYNSGDNKNGKGDEVSDKVDFDPWLRYDPRTTLYVDDDAAADGVGSMERPFATIQEAVDSAQDDFVIRVFAGSYSENVVVERTLSLIGNGSDSVTLDGGESGNVLEIKADGCRVSGLTFIGSGDSEDDSGIMVSSDGNTISWNNCSNNENGIRISQADNNTILGNNCTGSGGSGISLQQATNSTLANNSCSGNVYGMRLNGSTDNTLVNNKLTSNDAGMLLLLSHRNGIRWNLIKSSSYACLELEESNQNQVRENLLTGSRDAISFDKAKNNNITRNKLRDNDRYGIYVSGNSMNNSAHGNVIAGNEDHGVYVHASSPYTVNATGNWWGDETGPYHQTTNTGGKGDSVTDYVDFDPWEGEDLLSVHYVDDDAPNGGDGSKEKPFNTIQDAVDASEEGDTIYIWNGSYEEEVLLERTLSLIGNGSESTTLKSDSNERAIVVSANWCNVSGLGFPQDHAIKVTSDYNHIFNNSFGSEVYWGIYLKGCQGNILENNTVEMRYRMSGFRLENAHNNTIRGNNFTIEKNAYGIELISSGNNNFENNNFSSLENSEGGYGANLFESRNNTFTGNHFHGNKRDVVLEDDSSRNVFSNNSFSAKNSGISMFYSPDNQILNCTFSVEERLGVAIYNSNDTTLRDNEFLECSIYLEGYYLGHWSSHTISTSNIVNGKPVRYIKEGSGIDIALPAGQVIIVGGDNITIRDQNISKVYAAILVRVSSDITIRNLTLQNYTLGMQLDRVTRGNISEVNASSGSWHGLRLQNSHGFTVWNSSFSFDTSGGIHLYESDNNSFSDIVFYRSSSGIGIERSSNNSITNSRFLSNRGGIGLYDNSNNNLIRGIIQEKAEGGGISISLSRGNQVLDCALNASSGEGEGVKINSCEDTLLSNLSVNFFRGGDGGIYIRGSEDTTVRNITCFQNSKNIYLEDSDYNLIEDCFLTRGSAGLELKSSEHNTFRRINATRNSNGMRLDYSNYNKFTDIICEESSGSNGIVLTYSDRNDFLNVSSSHNGGTGVYLSESERNNFVNVTCNFNTGEGFNIQTRSNYAYLENCEANNNNVGIQLYYRSDDATISDTEVMNNDWLGFYLYQADDAELSGLTITGNPRGFWVRNTCQNNEIHDSIIAENTDYGVDNTDNPGYSFDATGNWWGSRSGPYHASTNSDGKGNEVTDEVEFDPWTGKTTMTVYVDDDANEGGDGSQAKPFRTIQEALDFSINGDTIRVWEGHYLENVQVNISVSLIGNGSKRSIIDGEFRDDVVLIQADWVNISGFGIMNSKENDDAGINSRGNHSHIFENTISRCAGGIQLNPGSLFENSGFNIIEDNTILDSNIGIYLGSWSENTLIQENFITNMSGPGIIASNQNHGSSIIQNVLDGASGGITLSSAEDSTIEDNILDNCLVGISVADVGNSSVDGNSIQGASYGVACSIQGIWDSSFMENTMRDCDRGIFLWKATNCSVEDNDIWDVTNSGIEMRDCRDTRVSENLVTNSTAGGGIFVYDESTNNSFLENTILSCEDGFLLVKADENLFSENTIRDSFGSGMNFLASHGNQVENSSIEGSDTAGILLNGSNENRIYHSLFPENGNGILLIQGSKDNVARYNQITDSPDFGINASFNLKETVNATYNWWGHRSGPYHEDDNPDGKGETVTDFVEFDPWEGKSSLVLFVDDDAPGGGDGTRKHPFNRIQDAIDVAEDWTTIKVWAGNYRESLDIIKPLILLGNGSQDTIIEGKAGDDCLYISSDWCNVSGFSLVDSGRHGIWINNGDFNTISNCTVSKSREAGIYLQYSDFTIIEDNIIQDCVEKGIYLQAQSTTIRDNLIDDSGMALYFSSSRTSIIERNTITNSKDGVYLTNSAMNSFSNNTFESNDLFGIRCISSDSTDFVDNRFKDNRDGGIYVMNSPTCLLSGNEMINNSIRFQGTVQSQWVQTMENNTVNGKPIYYYNNKNGISVPQGAGQVILANCTDMVVEGQDLNNATNAISVGFSKNIEISGNTIEAMKWESISIWISDSITISENLFRNNSWDGINILDAENCLIDNNIFRGTGRYAICFEYAVNNNIISNNYFLQNDNYNKLIYLQNSNSNSILYNSFLENMNTIYLKGSSENNSAHYNRFIDDKDFAVDASTCSFTLNATDNWWSDKSGPSGEGEGNGSKVSTNVIFTPWYAGPETEILEPGSGVLLSGESSRFSGTAGSWAGIASFLWESSIEGELQSGSISDFETGALSSGEHEISFMALDGMGIRSEPKIITLVIHDRPEASIDEIEPQTALVGKEVTFKGEGDDDGDIVRGIWISSRDGVIHNGSELEFTTDELSTGTHIISFKVLDDQGVWSEEVEATIIIHEKPVVGILFIDPNPGQTGKSISFTASGSDDGEITLYSWRTGGDELYNGSEETFSTPDLKAGSYTIYLVVQDDNGAWSREVSESLVVYQAPIVEPPEFESENVLEGETVHFKAEAEDDGSITHFVWSSDIDGEFYNGSMAEFDHRTLTVGHHNITLQVRDDSGIWSEPVTVRLLVKAKAAEEPKDEDEPFFLFEKLGPLPVIAYLLLVVVGIAGAALFYQQNASAAPSEPEPEEPPQFGGAGQGAAPPQHGGGPAPEMPPQGAAPPAPAQPEQPATPQPTPSPVAIPPVSPSPKPEPREQKSGTWSCSKCGLNVGDKFKFCVECGNKRPEDSSQTQAPTTWPCPDCGHQTDMKFAFCVECGTKRGG